MSFLPLSNSELIELGKKKHQEYVSNDPFPHIYFDNFFDPNILKDILGEFPELGGKKDDIQFNNPNENKHAAEGEYRFGELTRSFMHFMNSQPFLEFLQELTGIDETLISDPYFKSGGYHQIKPGGFLKVHVDFHKHLHTHLDRRVNVLVYLNEDWKEEYGGHFELWEKDMSECKVKLLPVFNRMAIFTTTDYSWHGHPTPLSCPEDRSRKSLALYYYSNGRPASDMSRGHGNRSTTTFAARKGEDSKKMVLFNNAVNLANDLLPPLVVRTIKKFRNR